MSDVFPYNECDTCKYLCDDGTDLLGYVYVSCGRDPFIPGQKCPHRERTRRLKNEDSCTHKIK